jgi:hypothetical protein
LAATGRSRALPAISVLALPSHQTRSGPSHPTKPRAARQASFVGNPARTSLRQGRRRWESQLGIRASELPHQGRRLLSASVWRNGRVPRAETNCTWTGLAWRTGDGGAFVRRRDVRRERGGKEVEKQPSRGVRDNQLAPGKTRCCPSLLPGRASGDSTQIGRQKFFAKIAGGVCTTPVASCRTRSKSSSSAQAPEGHALPLACARAALVLMHQSP